ncbi:hypothetical protein B0T17DRAFT_524303 [Bombardia bombarda]|uniref:DUF676 domain-containing protein n=1 Tax=Bombardia bombarda TaxID=252184 RepID=A0AA40C8D5_9PEZI|nr:hypothetical protein B0T17DRAFT_524303 [Bombardia bombarda]
MENRGQQDVFSKAEAGPSTNPYDMPPPQDPALEASPSQSSRETAVGTGTSTEPREVPAGMDLELERGVTRQSGASASSQTDGDHEARFVYVDGDIGGPSYTGYNDTKVDIIAVPCPGADPKQTWISDPLPDLSPQGDYSWVTQGIRTSASTARVLLYKHRALTDGINLEVLAMDLLNQVQRIRQGIIRPSRPLFFMAHSIGGLVVKLALLRAMELPDYRTIMYNCHGVSFFGTPHRGSSYMSMKNLKESIRTLLHLERSLPKTLADEVRINNHSLLAMHEQFVNIASELRIWTLYETIDSQLSGSGGGLTSEVQFGAPLVSIKSALLDVRQEDVFSVDNDHAHVASFGPNNIKTMNTFMKDLIDAIFKAEKLSDLYIHTPLKLKEHVKIELIGFYEDPDAEMDSAIRLYFTKYHLGEFLVKGPEQCLEERLKLGPNKRLSTGSRKRGGQTIEEPPSLESSAGGTNSGDSGDGGGLGIQNITAQGVVSRGDVDLLQGPATNLRLDSPDILVTSASARPSLAGRGQSPHNMTSLSGSNLHPSGSDSFHHSSIRTMSEPSYSLHRTDSRDVNLTSRQRADFLSRASALHDLTAGFSRPDSSLKKFMWIHLPFTNPVWVKEIFNTLGETRGENLSKLFNKENWVSKHVQGLHSLSQPSFLKPSCSYITADPVASPWMSPHADGGGRMASGTSGNVSTNPNCLYLYLPYLHFDTYRNLIKRRSLIEKRIEHGRASPVPQEIADLESLELRVIWQHLGYDPPLNCRRTLDQFGYPSLRDTNARDDDQMLYKLTKQDPAPLDEHDFSKPQKAKDAPGEKKTGGEQLDFESEAADSDLRDGNLLMVDQLWLWAIDTTTLTTFFPKRESSPKEGTLFQQADLRNSIYNELNGDLTGRTENALDLAAFTVLHAITVFLENASHPDLDIFRIFEEAIGLLAERMTWNMKQFRTQTFSNILDDSDDENDNYDENSVAAIKKRHKRELERAERENRENTSALLELRDMEDELTTLQRLFDIQDTTIRSMKAILQGHELSDITRNGQGYLDEALEFLAEYKQQTTEMVKRVDTTRKDYEKMLEMAQRQAQVDEVRWSRLQTELASSQNLSVMIFTTFTVIFLPLSFFTSLFGMNASEWQDENIPSLAVIGSIALPASVFLILASLLAAFSSRVQWAFRATYKQGKTLWTAGRTLVGKLAPAWEAVRESLRRMEPESAREAKERRAWEREKRERRKKMERRMKRQADRSFDLWATMRRQMTTRYEIPDLNRKREVGGDGSGGRGVVKRKTWLSSTGRSKKSKTGRSW